MLLREAVDFKLTKEEVERSDNMVNEKIYNWNLTKEEEKFLENQLKNYREEKEAKEEARKEVYRLLTEMRDICAKYNIHLYYDENGYIINPNELTI